MSDRLCSLHDRLISDTRTAFRTTGHGHRIIVTPTPAGGAWLKDYGRYQREWRRLELKELDPAKGLRERFGYIHDEPAPAVKRLAQRVLPLT